MLTKIFRGWWCPYRGYSRRYTRHYSSAICYCVRGSMVWLGNSVLVYAFSLFTLLSLSVLIQPVVGRSSMLHYTYNDAASPRQKVYASTFAGGLAGGTVGAIMSMWMRYILDYHSTNIIRRALQCHSWIVHVFALRSLWTECRQCPERITPRNGRR